MTADASPLEDLLDHLKAARGFDFTGYKRTTLERRVLKRMAEIEVPDYVAYRDHLEANPDEFAALFNTILINVTGFFRDPAVWEHLAESTIPALIARTPDAEPIRVWCAGCSTGEETYTIAMLLADALGTSAFLDRVKVYATDVDDDALAVARAGRYGDKAIEGLPPRLLEEYFVRQDRIYAFRKDLRRTVIFGRNDLVQDAPISRIDLLSCRNTLMYFNSETQSRILRRFRFALNDRGTLLLGKSEMLVTHSGLFVAADLKRRLFVKAPRTEPVGPTETFPTPEVGEPRGAVILDLAFDAAPAAQVVVDAKDRVVAVNGRARSLFGLTPADIGRPLRDLELSYRPVDLRSNLEMATTERRTVLLANVSHTDAAGERRVLDVQVTPVITEATVVGALIAFADVTVQQGLRAELETSKAELENAYDELQSAVEELETTNEELQSTNEELETTNEELQSTNEELETMNEELQSTNAELETINEELRARSTELDEVNGFLETILTAMDTAVVVVDGQLIVQLWNGHAEELFGLRVGDVQGKALLSLDVGLPVGELADPLREVLRGTVPMRDVELDATNRRGRAFRCAVSVLPLDAQPGSTYGAILLISVVSGSVVEPQQPAVDAPA